MKTKLIERLRYEFDKSMAAGPIALIGWLAVFALTIVLIVGTAVFLGNINPEGTTLGFFEGLWATLMRTLDSGNVGGDNGWSYRFVMLAVTLFGIMVIASFISILSNALNDRFIELRKGRSRVLESGHTIIFNWSASIFDVLRELIAANLSRKHATIVVMAAKDKVMMEDEIAAKLEGLGSTRIICRSGDPTNLYDLAIASPPTCKSIIVLSPEGENSDSQTIKTILSLVHDPERRKEPYSIVAELREERSVELARVVGGHEVRPVLADELIARIIVHSSRQAGLSAVYSELLDFEGSEIYFAQRPRLAGLRFGDALLGFEHCVLIGLRDANGTVRLNPPMDRVIREDDTAIVIAVDDEKIEAGGAPKHKPDDDAIRDWPEEARKPERTLILGWNRRGAMVARAWARFVTAGSGLTIVSDSPEPENEITALSSAHSELRFDYRTLDTSDHRTLDALDVPSYDHVVVLSYSDKMAAQAADTRTLVTLLHLRKIAQRAHKPFGVISEISDVRNRELAEVTRADDFVVSNKLVSLMLAQVSEEAHLATIFEELLDERGSEIYMRPVSELVAIDKPLDFYTIVEAAKRRGEVAIGYRRLRGNENLQSLSGVVVNPVKGQALDYREADRIIVLARN